MNGHPIRVAHVALQLNVGGMEKLLVEFARYADRDRFDLRFVSLGARGSLASDLEACGWPVIALNEQQGARWGLIVRLIGLFRRLHLDVVHTHNTKPLIYAGPAARLAGVPAVLHTRHGQRFQAGSRQTALFRLATRLANRVVGVSKDSTRLSAQEGVAPRKLCTIANAIDVSRFSYTGPREEGPALMVGRLSPEKDVATLLRATALVVRACPTFRLLIAGDGKSMPALKELTAELGLQEHVRFLGEVRDVPALLAGASMFVLSSLTEGISLTLLEAMARGLPVIATRVGGNPEVVIDGATGLLVPAQSPLELAQAVLRLLADPARSRQMGLAARQCVERHFDVRQMVAAYEVLYAQLCGCTREPVPALQQLG